MRLYFRLQLTPSGELLSLAAVREDGRAFVGHNLSCDLEAAQAADPPGMEPVLTHLPGYDDPSWMYLEDLAEGFLSLAAPELDLWYCAPQTPLSRGLAALFGEDLGALPTRWRWLDLHTAAVVADFPLEFSSPAEQHAALPSALWCRTSHERLREAAQERRRATLAQAPPEIPELLGLLQEMHGEMLRRVPAHAGSATCARWEAARAKYESFFPE